MEGAIREYKRTLATWNNNAIRRKYSAPTGMRFRAYQDIYCLFGTAAVFVGPDEEDRVFARLLGAEDEAAVGFFNQ